MQAGDWIALFGVLLGASGGLMAIFTYRRDVAAKRTDWLYDMFSDFYAKENYKTVRRLLDYRQGPEFEQLKADAMANQNTELNEKLADYMNFFEFVVGLQRRNRISRDELCWLFDYYIDCIAAQDWLRDYVQRFGFEQLSAEIRIRTRKAKAG